VYFTLGTVFNMESGDLFTRVLLGLRELAVDVVATVGVEIDPATFGAQPPNVRIARYVPQSSVLARADAVVSHGGSGTVLGALAYGVPSVLLPMGADQPVNAARCESLGIARILDATACTSHDVSDAVSAVLTEPTYREHARQLRDETQALPGAPYAFALLETLATERQPIPRAQT
jgi:MGT family glycosyltransferase